MAKRPAQQTYYERSEAYAKQVSGEIIEQIKKGTAPWMKPWKPGEQIGATNVATGKAYTGGNSLYLMSRQISEGRGDNRWGTYRQIEAMGGQVRRGEKGTQVLFYQNRTEQPAKDEEGKIRKDKDGKTIYEEAENVRACDAAIHRFQRGADQRIEVAAQGNPLRAGMGHAPGGRQSATRQRREAAARSRWRSGFLLAHRGQDRATGPLTIRFP